MKKLILTLLLSPTLLFAGNRYLPTGNPSLDAYFEQAERENQKFEREYQEWQEQQALEDLNDKLDQIQSTLDDIEANSQ
jgi:hypothetical protein